MKLYNEIYHFNLDKNVIIKIKSWSQLINEIVCFKIDKKFYFKKKLLTAKKIGYKNYTTSVVQNKHSIVPALNTYAELYLVRNGI